jgi:hypothetical protein
LKVKGSSMVQNRELQCVTTSDWISSLKWRQTIKLHNSEEIIVSVLSLQCLNWKLVSIYSILKKKTLAVLSANVFLYFFDQFKWVFSFQQLITEYQKTDDWSQNWILQTKTLLLS